MIPLWKQYTNWRVFQVSVEYDITWLQNGGPMKTEDLSPSVSKVSGFDNEISPSNTANNDELSVQAPALLY